MAQVPLQSFGSVEPNATPPNDYQSIQASPAAFGGMVGAAEQRTGANLEQASNDFTQMALVKQQRFNQISTDDAFNNFQTSADNLTYGNPSDPSAAPGLYTLRGADALRAGPLAVKSLTDTRDQIKAGLQNDAQRLLFDEQSRRILQYKSAEISRHLDQQADVYGLAVNKATIENSQRSAGLAYNSDDAIMHSLQDSRQGAVRAAQIQYGQDAGPEIIKNAISQSDNGIIRAAIYGASAQDPQRASAILDKFGAQLDPNTRAELTQHLKSVNSVAIAHGAVMDALGAPTGAPAQIDTGTRMRAQAVHDEFVRQGTPDDEAWGWAANAVHESGGNTAPKAGDSGASHGLFQWNHERLALYEQTYGHPPEQGTLSEQVAFAKQELGSTEAGAEPAIAAAQGVGGKAAAISSAFIRPRGGAGEAQNRASTAALLAGQDPNVQLAGGATPTAFSNGAATTHTLPDKDAAYARVMADPRLASNPLAQQQAIAQLNRMYAVQDKVAKERYEGTLNPLVTQMISDPTKIDPVKDIANNPNLTADQKQKVWEMYNTHLKQTGDDKDTKTYGPGFWDVYKAVNAPASDPGKITDPQVLVGMAGPGGALTVAGVDKLQGIIAGRRSPDGEAEQAMKKQFFTNAKSQISGSDEGLHIRDPKGDELYLKFLAHAMPAYDAGRKAGLTPAQMLDPDSKDYIGKSVATFKRPMSVWVKDMVDGINGPPGGAAPGAPVAAPAAAKAAPDMTTRDGIVAAYRSGAITREEASAQLVARGFAAAPKPAPVTGASLVPTGE